MPLRAIGALAIRLASKLSCPANFSRTEPRLMPKSQHGAHDVSAPAPCKQVSMGMMCGAPGRWYTAHCGLCSLMVVLAGGNATVCNPTLQRLLG